MENFVLYEDITNSPNIAGCTTTHKGRRKGTIAFLAISSVKKRARAPVTNHVRFVSELRHPLVVQFMEWYETTNHLWLVFELCSGGDLDTLLQLDGALPETAIRQFGMDLVRALHYLHSSDIVYADLCPSKVLIDNEGQMKLADFSLAFKNGELLSDLYCHFVDMGGGDEESDLSAGADGDADGGGGGGQIREPQMPQLDWLAPEMVRGDQPCADYKSDLWSLGALLYHMFTGRPPFAAATAKDVAEGIVYKQLPPPRVKGARLTGKPSNDFSDLVGRLLDKDPDTRLDWPELISHSFWQGKLADLAGSYGDASPRKSMALNRIVGSITDKKFDTKSLPVPPLSPDRLAGMSAAEVARHAGVLAQAFASSGSERGPPSQKRINLVSYAVSVFSATATTPAELARPLLASGTVANDLLKQIRETTHADLKLRLCRLLAHLFCLAAPLLASATPASATPSSKLQHPSASCETWPLGESATQLTEMLREQFRNTKLKQALLAALGELLVAISAGESALGKQVAKWIVPAMTVNQVSRCLHSSEEVVTSHLACKIIEKVCGYQDTQHAARFSTQELGQLVWSTLRLATLDSLRICAAVSLSRMCRISPAICQSVVDKAGLSSVLDCLNAPSSLTRVQQSVLSMLGASLICSPTAPFSKKLSQDRDFLHSVLKQLESPNPLNRAKAFLIVDSVVRNSPDSLNVCCNLRLLVYVERDSRRDTPGAGRGAAGVELQAHLYHCLDLLVGTLCACVPGVTDQILAALDAVAGRKHPSNAQAKQLRQWLPLTSVLAQLSGSPALRSRIVQAPFLSFLGQLLSHCQALDCHKTVVEPAVSHEEVITTALTIAESLVLHPNLLVGCGELVAKQLLPPLGGLIGSSVVETRVVAMKIFAEMCCHLLAQDIESESVAAAIDDLIIPQSESLLLEAEPAPCFLLKLLGSYCEAKPSAAGIVQLAGLPQLLLQLLADRHQRDSKAASALLPDSVPALGTCFTELASAATAPAMDPAAALESATHLQAVLDPVVSDVARRALQLRRTMNNNTAGNQGNTANNATVNSTLSSESCAAEAERLLVTVRPLADLTGPLVRLLCHEDPEVDEQSLKALSHLASLFGGEHCDWLGPECLDGFSRIVLRILKRFAATSAAANQLAPGLLSAESASGLELLRSALMDTSSRADNAADA
uniref:Protein kinase domain-containing protein n=1 Tax=Macrostomum lignano TaxID=282301 RepID=A0A1I8H1B3_9PLAT